MEGNLLQLLLTVAIVLLWVLAGSRKRERRSPARRPPALPDRWPRRRAGPPAPRREMSAEELYQVLTGETPPPGPGDVAWGDEARPLEEALEPATETEEARPLEEVSEVEARSLETLEAAGDRSHQRFHQKYLAQPASQPGAEPAAPRRPRPAVDLRQAIIWREILGPPKGGER